MKTTKRTLSMFLALCMLLSLFPMSVLTVSAAPGASTEAVDPNDYTDIDMDFNYPYSNPRDVMEMKANAQTVNLASKDAGQYNWKHATSFGNTSGTLRSLLQSTADSDKYIVVDKDLSTTSAHTDYETIVIKSDKVLDLNGHQIKLLDKRNKVDTHDDYIDKYYQSDNSADFQSVMFSIQSGATLTIIDSSKEQTGEIYTHAYMIDPYAHRIKRYTTRDIFNVDDGNLVVYGGTFQAGRSKAQSDDDLFEKIETVVGDAVALATDIAGYATGINAATGAYEDAVFNANQAMEAIKKAGNSGDGNENKDKQQSDAATAKKDGTDAKPETKTETPDGKDNSNAARNKTVSEKQQDKDKAKKNQSNENHSAQYDGNSKIAAAENAITDAATNKDKINTMVSSAFQLAKSIKSCFETDENSIVTQSFLGTVVNVGNGGTFVSYGGRFIGYGMTPNIRNGVVECTTVGKVYVYGGVYEGRCGANIFNIVKYNNSLQKVTQYVEDTSGTVSEKEVNMRQDETNGVQILSMVNKVDSNGNVVYEDGKPVKVPVNTSNIRVRGGTFRCYYEATMVGLHKDSSEGANDHNSDQMTMFVGSAGGVNLGVESYNEDLIRDGRIQLVDSYGDGALVLMDDNKDAGDNSIFHYRLFCTDEELRRNRYLTVYPNEPGSNSTYSFSLQTRYNSQDTGTYEDVAQAWSDSSENDRGVFSSDERFFTYPINDKDLSEKYYVIPHLTNTDVFGQNLDTSEVWYYNTPVDTRGRRIESFEYGVSYAGGTVNTNGNNYSASYSQAQLTESEWNKVEKKFVADSVYYQQKSKNYRNTIKWITYKVYRVDPLTRLNITNIYGVDQPVAKVSFGASDDALKCRLPLDKLGIEYKAGEMYRVVMSVDEYLSYNGTANALDNASCQSSIVFMCYDTDEYKIENNQKTEDYTPVQWINTPEAGSRAAVQIINGQAGLIDYQKRKIFDVYYQWYEVNPDGEDILIAGTDNIFTKKLDTFTADLVGEKKHNFRMMLPGSDGFTYVNTVNPNDPDAADYGANGLPADTADWTVEMLHAYIESNTPNSTLTKNTNYALSPSNNRTMATNYDTCYIPESCEGKTIYCKVTAVNNFWLRNFDHVQVFYSHKVTVPVKTKPLKADLKVTYSGDYVTTDNQAVISLDNITGLDPDEVITQVKYIAENTAAESICLENLSAVNADSVKSVSFPKDFFDEGIPPFGARSGIRLVAKITTNKGRVEYTKKTVIDYEVPATDLNFIYAKGYFYDGIYHNTEYVNPDYTDKFRIEVTPKNASMGYSLSEGGSFTSSDPEVASFDNAGKLIPGTKEGRTTITLNTPSGTAKTLVFANPIRKIEVSGIDAPVIGQSFDLTADVPEGANYTVKEVYWTEGKYGDRLSANAVAQPYRSYTVHVVLKEKNGQEFSTDDDLYWVNDSYQHLVKTPYAMTVNLSDGTTDTIDSMILGVTDFVWKADRLNTVETSYSFPAYAEDGSDQIDTVIINYPTEVAQGDSVRDWLDQLEVSTAAGSAVSVAANIGYTERASDITSALGYSTYKLPVFIKGVQSAVNIALDIPMELSPRFVDGKIKVILNGEEYNDSEQLNGLNHLNIAIYDAYTIKDGAEIRKAPVFNVDNAYMVAGETLNLNDLLSSKESIEYTIAESYSNEYSEYNTDTNVLAAKKAYTDTATRAGCNYINGIVMWDINGDGINETPISRTTRLVICASADDLPDVDSCRYTINAKKPDGTDAYTVKRYLDQEPSSDSASYYKSFSIPEIDNAFICSMTADNGGYFDYHFGAEDIRNYHIYSDKTVTVNTVSADSIKLSPSKNELYVTFDQTPSGIYLSVDNETFYGGSHLTGLTPDTEYTLYYKQGINGTVYNKSFRTASVDYGVTVGKTMVTDKFLGDLDKDGWHYDPSTLTLTLKDLTLSTRGTSAEMGSIAGQTASLKDGAIVSTHNITIQLMGSNTIEKLSSGGMVTACIMCLGDVTLTGNGNLTMRISGMMAQAVNANGNIYLNSNGKVEIIGGNTGIYLDNYNSGTIYYRSGEYIYHPNYYDSISLYSGSLIDSRTALVMENTHSMTASYGYTLDTINDNTLTAENIPDLMKATDYKSGDNCPFVHITPVHTCTKKIQSAEYFVEGSCEEGATYYKSCSCGYTDKKSTFTVAGGSHSYTYYDGKAATCLEDGWKSYKVCTKCGDTDYEAIPATGNHHMVNHPAQAPTCTEHGWEAYGECTECGLSTYVEIPATGHTLTHHEAKAPTCTEPGWEAYDTCECCDYTTFTEIPANGHHLVHHDGKEATETENGWEPYDECTECNYSTYTVIPAKKALTNESVISADTVTVGNSITITGKAEGGKAPYKFAFYYKKSTSSSWATIGTEYDGTASAEFKPASAASYNVRVRVKDANGTVKEKIFTVTSVKALTNNSTVSSEKPVVNSTVTLTGAASGGTSPYTYAFYYKKSTSKYWTTIGTEFGSAATGSFKVGAIAEYNAKISVKDGSGTVVSKEFTITSTAASTELANTSTVSTTTIPKDTAVSVKGGAAGGKGDYKYSFCYKKSTSAAWISLGELYGNTTEVTFVPAAVAKYLVKINVKDSSGKVVTKQFTVNSVKPTSTDLVNNSKLDKMTTVRNNPIQITAAAKGGAGGYKYAFYYKKATSKAFTAIGEEYGSATSATFTPASTGEYNVRINVKDSKGTLVVKQYKITSTAALTNNSTISATSVSVGSAVTITGAANGGSGEYTYKFSYRKSTSKYPTEITPDGNTAVFKPGSKAEYIVTVSVTDSTGTVAEKQFTVTST